jgi:hypothetical protein
MGLSLQELEQQTTECLPARDVMSSLGSSGASGLVPKELEALLPAEVTQLTDGVTAAVPALPSTDVVDGLPTDAVTGALPTDAVTGAVPGGLPL